MLSLKILVEVFLMIIVIINAKPFESKRDKFACGESPSVSKYIGYNNMQFQNKLLTIIHGHDSVENDWPWIVTLNTVDLFFCTGSIVSPNYVLTAHHCLFSDNVGYGSVNETLQKHVRIVEKHYFNNTDFGLVKVEKPFEFDGKNIAPICLSSKFDADPNEILAAAGYGVVFLRNLVDDKKEIFPAFNSTKILQETTIEHRADSWCKHEKYNPETMICIGGAASGVAPGDSGSPLMAIRNNKWYSLGTLYAGFFESIASDDLVRITHAWYTKVKPYCNWIAEVTHGEAKCE